MTTAINESNANDFGFMFPVRDDVNAKKLSDSINWSDWERFDEDNNKDYYEVESILYTMARRIEENLEDNTFSGRQEALEAMRLYALSMGDRDFFILLSRESKQDKTFWVEASDYFATLVNMGDKKETFIRFEKFQEKKMIEAIPKSKIFNKLADMVDEKLDSYSDDLHRHDKTLLSDADKKKTSFIHGSRSSGTNMIVFDFTQTYPIYLPSFLVQSEVERVHDIQKTFLFEGMNKDFLYSDGKEIISIDKETAKTLADEYFERNQKLINYMGNMDLPAVADALFNYKEKKGKRWKSKLIEDHWNTSNGYYEDNHPELRRARNHFGLVGSDKEFAKISKAENRNEVQQILVENFVKYRNEEHFTPEKSIEMIEKPKKSKKKKPSRMKR